MKPLIVVTGGTKGIGRAIVDRFVAEGFDAIVCARSIDGISGPGLLPFSADLSSRSGVDALVAYVESLNRPVDVLVNNTGVFQPGQIHNEAEGTFEQLMTTNVGSAYHLTRGLVRDMMIQRKGHIFMMCSTASITPYINGGSYCISKFALLGMSRVLREELKPHDVKVTAILPGATLTASWTGTDLPEDRFMKPEDVAESTWMAYSLSKSAVVEEILIRPQLGDI
ncbi:SDR family oxidoreductase [Spirosoma utsteinense]|uniref:NAD(P)-dependent dehydrogenase (Short-subunit alcohol dehydrogenase family) n=1 Tax=Spirosoma utsteinense TaxID=2585773 RepID=A0ABR6W3G2_9BACT|nr:SDR family oxidoreductase [Spirosoma utsteinense]MBC3784812.1 NAD(P)-dependent dehydrogenase (short-subunit alcohol dehydrogenase family) [Spirosoma utsteinense]MBC3791151.1 NAD(P)-dependent dehydrogenase (short-subunit alcohol dehydrogenase family) [Spirosoma utsteinense]